MSIETEDYLEDLNLEPQLTKFLIGNEARAWAKDQELRNTSEAFGTEKQAFEEALRFVLNPQNEKPYVVVIDRKIDALDESPLGVTVGKIEEDIGYRDWRIVRPDQQRRGFGQMMHDFEVSNLPDFGVTTVYTEAYTDAGRKFIERQGYAPATDGWYYLDLRKAA